MNTIDYYQRINELLAINGLTSIKEIDVSNSDTPLALQIIELLFEKHFADKQGFIEKKITNEHGLFIYVKNHCNLTVYKIKSEDLHIELPICYNSFNNEFSLSDVLLVELALWLFSNVAQHKIAYKRTVKGLHNAVEDNFSYICKTWSFSLYERENCYILISPSSIGSYLVATNDKILKTVKLLLNATKPPKQNIVLKTDIIQNLTLKDNRAKGDFSFMGNNVKIELDTELEFPEQQDYEKLIAQLNNFTKYFTNTKISEYKAIVAKEIIDSVYQQDDYIPKEKDYEKLYNEFIFKKIYVTNDAFILTFKAKKMFKGNNLSLQISYPDFEIEEVEIF